MEKNFIPGIGNLEIQQIFVAEQQPLLFSASNDVGDTYLVSYADTTELEEIWMLARLSDHRLNELMTGKSDIRSIFIKNETGSVSLVRFNHNDTEVIISHKLSNDPDLLEYLAQPGIKIPLAADIKDIKDSGIVLHRDKDIKFKVSDIEYIYIEVKCNKKVRVKENYSQQFTSAFIHVSLDSYIGLSGSSALPLSMTI